MTHRPLLVAAALTVFALAAWGETPRTRTPEDPRPVTEPGHQAPDPARPAPVDAELERLIESMAKVGHAYGPSFSPDGRRVAFLSDLSGAPQAWIVASDGGWPRQVTALDDQVRDVRWSPADDDLLAIIAAPGGGLNQQVYLVRADGTGLRRLTAGGRETNYFGDWSRDGRWLALSTSTESGGFAVSIHDLERDKRLPVGEYPGFAGIAGFDAGSERAIVWSLNQRGDNDLYLLRLADGARTLLTPHEPPASFIGVFAYPPGEGRTVYLSTNDRRDLTAFARLEVSPNGEVGATDVLAERPDAELSGFVLSPAGRRAALLWNVGGRSELDFLDLATGAVVAAPPLPAEVASGLEYAPDGTRLAMVLSGATAPSDVWVLDLENRVYRQITHSPHPGVDLDALIRPELVTFAAHDGLELSGWLYRPPGADGPGPAVLNFHGGPEAQDRPSFRALFQALLLRGVAVFSPNVRGSSGFGKRFVNLDNGALRADAVKDIESAARYLIDRGIAAPGRLGIMGGSYGGYMVMAGLADYPDLFAAGANLFGVVNFETFFEQTEPYIAAVSYVEYGNPNTERDLLRALSPIHRVDRVKAPTIVLHGANDTNVPVIEAEQVIESLKRRGVPVEYILFPDEGHGFRRLPNRVRSTLAIVDWFDKYLKAP